MMRGICQESFRLFMFAHMFSESLDADISESWRARGLRYARLIKRHRAGLKAHQLGASDASGLSPLSLLAAVFLALFAFFALPSFSLASPPLAGTTLMATSSASFL